MGDGLTFLQLHQVVRNHFGRACSSLSLDSAANEVECILYETYPLRCSLDELDGFGANIGLGRTATAEFFGDIVSMNSTVAAIEESLRKIDEWCRLHLPDKFLARFDAALNESTNAAKGAPQ